MARTKGMLNLSGNLEVNAQAPLDARTIVPAEADLTVASNFPYPYIGLEVYVTGTGKKFRLINLDTTQSSSWHEISEGGGSGGGGHTIQDDGTDMPARDNLNFVGFDVTDDSTNNRTTVAFPNINLSTLGVEAFRFSTDEKPVGQWTDGKLLYAKTVTGTVPTGSAWFDIPHGISNIDKVCFSKIGMVSSAGAYITIGGADDSYSKLYGMVSKSSIGLCIVPNNDYKGYSIIATVFYTKTTDSPLATGERYAGVDASGNVVYERTFSTVLPNSNSLVDMFSAANITKCHFVEGYFEDGNGYNVPIDRQDNGNYQVDISVKDDGTKIYFGVGTGAKGKNVTLKMRYTKAS